MLTTPISKRQLQNVLAAQLKNARSGFDSHYKELGEYFAPSRTRFTISDKNKGDKRYGKIINESGLLYARILKGGMFTGITSPARPWRRLTTPDPELAEFGRVKVWLDQLNKNMRALDVRSNLYNCLPTVFGDCGIFATAAMGVFDDDEDDLRCYTFPIGSYWLGLNHRQVVSTFMREFSLTVRQLVMQFGDPLAKTDARWANFSRTVRDAWDRGNYETLIPVTQIISPNVEYDSYQLTAKYKKFSSCYLESYGTVGTTDGSYVAGDSTIYLRESGMDRFQILAPRWEVTGEDAYGTSCPGMEALATMKEIQTLEKRKSRAIEKQLNPALKGPSSLMNQKVSLLAGDITLVDERDGGRGLSPIHETNVNINDVNLDIERKEQRLAKTFYADLFLMISQMEGIQPRNTAEIAERREEKLLALGSVLESMNDELLDPLTDLEFDRMQVRGLIPEAPPELAGMELRVDYESIMAKAQKLVGVAGTERFFSFLGNAAAAFPQALDKVDIDAAVDEYSDMMGVSPKIIRTEDQTEEIRQQKAQAAQKQQAMAAIPQLAEAGKNLAGADLSTDNALSRMLAGA